MSNELARVEKLPFNEIMTISKAFAESGMFTDAKSAAQAFVKISAGNEIGIPPFASMSGISIIQGKPSIGAGLMASRLKGSGKYDYKILQQDEQACEIEVLQNGKSIGKSRFTKEDAQKAGTKNMDKFPRNMLFARAMSNAVKWFAPDIFSSPVYTPEELEQVTEDIPPGNVTVTTVIPPAASGKKDITPAQFKKVAERVYGGDLDALNGAKNNFNLSDEKITELAGHALTYSLPMIKDNPDIVDVLRGYTLNDGKTSPYTEAQQSEITQAGLPY